MRILLILVRNFERHKNTKYILLRELGLTHLNTYYRPHHGDTIDSISVNERHFLFTVISRLFNHSLNEIIHLFKKAKITKEILSVRGIPPSDTIVYITSKLKSRTREKFTRERKKSKVQVKSKEIVERIMSDIRQYL